MYPKSRGPTIELFFLTRLPGPCGMNRKQNIISIPDYSNIDNLFQDFHKRLFLCPPGLLVRESQEEVEIDIGVTSPTSVVTGGPCKFSDDNLVFIINMEILDDNLVLIINIVSSVRSSYSHPNLLLIHHPTPPPTFSDHTGPQHWTFTF